MHYYTFIYHVTYKHTTVYRHYTTMYMPLFLQTVSTRLTAFHQETHIPISETIIRTATCIHRIVTRQTIYHFTELCPIREVNTSLILHQVITDDYSETCLWHRNKIFGKRSNTKERRYAARIRPPAKYLDAI